MGGLVAAINAEYDNATPRKIKVPEWEEVGHGAIFVWPETVAQYAKIAEASNAYEKAVLVVVIRGKDKDGRRIFSEAEQRLLMERGVGKFGPQVISRVAAEIYQDRMEKLSAEGAAKVADGETSTVDATVEDAEKK